MACSPASLPPHALFVFLLAMALHWHPGQYPSLSFYVVNASLSNFMENLELIYDYYLLPLVAAFLEKISSIALARSFFPFQELAENSRSLKRWKLNSFLWDITIKERKIPIYTCTYTHTYALIYIYAYTNTCITCIHPSRHAYTHASIAYIRNIYPSIHPSIHTYMHTYISSLYKFHKWSKFVKWNHISSVENSYKFVIRFSNFLEFHAWKGNWTLPQGFWWRMNNVEK